MPQWLFGIPRHCAITRITKAKRFLFEKDINDPSINLNQVKTSLPDKKYIV
jgi:hypothetical protein